MSRPLQPLVSLRRLLATLARSVGIFVPVFLVATFVTFATRPSRQKTT